MRCYELRFPVNVDDLRGASVRLTERLDRLRRSTRATPGQSAPPPCVGCRDRAGRLEPIDSEGVEPSTDASCIGPIPGLQTAIVDDQLIVLDPVTARRVVLNSTAALIYTAFDTERRVGDVVAQIADQFGTDIDVVGDVVRSTIDRLLAQGMLHRDDLDEELPTESTDDPYDAGVDREVADRTSDVDWAYDSGPLEVAGISVGWRAESPTVAARLEAALAGFASGVAGRDPEHRIDIVDVIGESTGGGAATEADADTVRIVVDGRTRSGSIAATAAASTAFDQLDLVLADHAEGLRFHAGAVERDGRVVVVLGQSGDGKSTLTAALVQSGWRYVTDELVVVDPVTLDVYGYARPLDLDERSRKELGIDRADLITRSRKDKVFPSRLGQISAGGRVATIIVLSGEESADEPLVVRLSDLDALMALLPLPFAASFTRPDALDQIARVCGNRTVKMHRAPLEAMVGAVESLNVAERSSEIGDPASNEIGDLRD